MEVLLKSFSGPSLKLPAGLCGADHSAAWGSSLLDRKVSIWGSNSTIEWNALLCMTSKQEMEEGGDFHLSCPLHLELNLGMHSILPWWVSFKWIPNRSKTTELSMSQLSELCLTPTRCIRLVCCPSQHDWCLIKGTAGADIHRTLIREARIFFFWSATRAKSCIFSNCYNFFIFYNIFNFYNVSKFCTTLHLLQRVQLLSPPCPSPPTPEDT